MAKDKGDNVKKLPATGRNGVEARTSQPKGRHRSSDRNEVGDGIVPNTGRHAKPDGNQ